MLRIVSQSVSPSYSQFSSQRLLSAPQIAGLLPAHAESLIKPPLNPHSLTLTDYRLETIPPKHHAVLMAVTKNLFRAAVDYLVNQDREDGDMYIAGMNFAGQIDELFAPKAEVIKPQPKARPPVPRVRTIEEMNADLEPILKDIAETAQRLGWMRKPGSDKGS